MTPTATLYAILTWIVSAAACMAASDTDVNIIQATKVVIENNKITINAEAITTIRTIAADHDPEHKGRQLFGRPCNVNEVKSDEATFVVHKPKEGPEGAWEMTVAAAKALKDGKKIGRIGYYRPDVLIRANLIISIDGEGYIYPDKDSSE